MRILGTKFMGHDCSVFLIDTDKKDIFAIDTERVTRIKHDNTDIEPILTTFIDKFVGVDYLCYSFCKFIDEAFSWDVITHQVRIRKILYDLYKPKYINDYENALKKTRIIKYINLLLRPRLFRKYFASWIYLFLRKDNCSPEKAKNVVLSHIEYVLRQYKIFPKEICFYEHHLCHAVPSYFFAPFGINEEAIVFTLDGWGDGAFSKLFIFSEYKWKELACSRSPVFFVNGKKCVASIGIIYQNFTEALGFKPMCDEGKVEALAAYGEPDKLLSEILRKSIYVDNNLCFKFNLENLECLYDINYIKQRASKIGKENVAATVQRWLEDIVVRYLNLVYKKFKIKNLGLAGGIVANVILNLNIFEKTSFENIYIFPAMGDSGTAAGAAILKAIELGEDLSWLKKKKMPYWGPSYTKEDVEKELKKDKWKNLISYEYLNEKWSEEAAKMVAEGKVVAIYQGKMEYGPRALGNRSILADPRNPKTRDKLNSTVKRRPWFQPFCPSVLEEDREILFEKSYSNKHMTCAFRLKKRYWDKIPSAMHVDGTARPQFIEQIDNPIYYKLIKKFKELTGYGIIVNTSFNLHGRTIVMTPEDAITDFLDSNIDVMFIEGFKIFRE